MRQSFDEHADPSFGPKHLPLIRQAMAEPVKPVAQASLSLASGKYSF